MLELLIPSSRSRPLRIACFGAHCDDIEIGCGGALLTLQSKSGAGPLRIDWVVLSGTAERRAECGRSMAAFVRAPSRGTLHFADFPDGCFPSKYGEIKKAVQILRDELRPDVIFCHEAEDRHQDHRAVNEFVWTTFRDQLIFEYEIPKWDGGLGQPNVYVPVSRAQADRKVQYLLRYYRSQAARDWFDARTFEALLRLRGVECRSPSGLAEAFHGRKITLARG